MQDKAKIKIQYKIQSFLMLVVSLVGVFSYFIEQYIILFTCLGILAVLIIIWRVWGKKVSNKYFNGKPVTEQDIKNYNRRNVVYED